MTEAAAKLPETPTIVRALRVELVKPLNYTWDEVGPVLRRQRNVMHRLMNAAVLGCIDSGRKIRADAPQTAAYREASLALAGFNEWLTKQPGEQTAIELPGGTLAGIGSLATDAWKRWVKSKGNERIPSFGKGQPIPIRAQESELQRDSRGFALRFNLHAVQGSKREWVRFALAASSGRHHQALRALTASVDGWETLALKLDYDERKRKWYALISYRKPADKAELDPTVVLVVHRGAHNFVGCMSSTGHWSTVSGQKLMAQKRKLKARRRDMQRVAYSERGDGAKGHGQGRRNEHHEAVLDKEARSVKTFCQQTAARIVQLATQWGCGTVVIGDYGGIEESDERGVRRFVPRVPLYQLKTAIANALQVRGIALSEISEAYVSQTCPSCAMQDAGAHNRRTGIFHCRVCEFSRPADWVSAKLMMRRVEPIEDVYENQLAQQRELAKQLRLVRGPEPERGPETEERADSTAQARGQSHSRTGTQEPDNPDRWVAHDPPPRIHAQTPARERRGGSTRKGAKTREKTSGATGGDGGARKPERKPAKGKRQRGDGSRPRKGS